MNQKYDYNAWKDRLDKLQNWWGKKFELQLEEFFKAEGELLQREPELKNRKTQVDPIIRTAVRLK